MTVSVDYRTLSTAQRRLKRLEYVESQQGLCQSCNAPLEGDPADYVMRKRINWNLFPPNFLKYPIHLHHNHTTGMTIGAVHARCNAYEWQYRGV